MAKEVIVLGIGRETLHGLRFAESGKDWTRTEEVSWPLVVEAPEAPAEEAEVEADAAEAPVASDPLADAFAAAVKHFGTHEFALAMPLSRLLVATGSAPLDARDDPSAAAGEVLDAVSPFPDEALAVGAEIVAETDSAVRYLAAALPEATSAEVGDALAVAKARVTHTDALALGWLRALWPRLMEKEAARRLVLMDLDGEWSVAVLDDGALAVLRGLGARESVAEIVRETMLSLLQCADGGRAETGDVAVCAASAPDPALLAGLATFGPVRTVLVEDPFLGVEGVALRLAEGAAFDVTPAAWVETRQEARFRKKTFTGLAVAGVVWLLGLGAMFGAELVYDHLTDQEKAASARHAKAYREVKDMRDRVKLVQRYSDHARGALEILKVFSDSLPADDMILGSFQYRRGESVRINGDAAQPTDVYAYKDALAKIEFEDGARLFNEVRLTGPSATRGGRHKYEIEAVFEGKEEK